MSAAKRKLESISDETLVEAVEIISSSSIQEDPLDSRNEFAETEVQPEDTEDMNNSSSLPEREYMLSNVLDDSAGENVDSSSFDKEADDSQPPSALVRELISPTETAMKTGQKKGKIKNPLSVWMIFSNENRDLIYKEFPEKNFTEGLLRFSCTCKLFFWINVPMW